MENINGVQVGTKIRNEYNDELTQIVYISGKTEYALELFDINPLNFLVKPLDYDKIEKVINKHLKITGFWTDVFSYSVGHDTFKIKLKEIMYLESNGKKIKMFLKDREEEFYGSLEEIYNTQLIKYDFLYIHKSYIVNYDYVSVFEYEKLLLTNGEKLPIGQYKRKEIRKIQNEIKKRRL
jgi:DNA-binding LytR/AlgR family response regulator